MTSSEAPEMSSELTVHDSTLKTRNQLKDLELEYIYAHILKRIQTCPETTCTINLPIQRLVEHILEAHEAVPKYIIELEQYGEVEVNLRDLELGKSYCVLALFIRINGNEGDLVSDSTTMPLMVMAAKINPCGPPVYTQFGDIRHPSDVQFMYPGELVMIWICGHLHTISSLIRVKAMEKVTNEYAGNIHSIADNNFKPNKVFFRGNCLLIPAHNIIELTQNGENPLKVEVQLSVRDE